MENKHVLVCISSAVAFCAGMNFQERPIAKVDKPTNYWEPFFTSKSDDFDKIEIQLDVSEVESHKPRLFPKNHPAIGLRTVTDPDLIRILFRSLTGVQGKAGAKLTKRQYNFSEKVGRITFVRGASQYEITVSNSGFFMGPDMNEFHLFYSWRLAKLVNDIALEAGPGLTQEGFNSLCGARSIAGNQYFDICEADWQDDGFVRYKSRPAEIWNILPSRKEWLEFKTNENDKPIKAP
jgi:hypothetical protein